MASSIINSKRIVPWISMGEWSQVYQMIYSEDYNQKLKGLNHMIVWKSRVPKLTLGVECSLHLLQAMLRDQELMEDPNNSLSESDIILMYSTAIIRFINLISHLGQVDLRHQPISAIAEMAGIPDWLVSIRHEATHAKMPSLGVLRPGAKLAMEWLEENYWRTEEEDSFDLHWPESKKSASQIRRARNNKTVASADCPNEMEKVPSFIEFKDEPIPEELQRAVTMLVMLLDEMPGREWMCQLPSKTLRRYGYEIWASGKLKPLSVPMSQKEIDKLRLPLIKVRTLVVMELDRILTQWTESLCAEGVIETSKEDATAHKGQCLVSAVCQCHRLLSHYKKGMLNNYAPLWRLVSNFRSIPLLIQKLASMYSTEQRGMEQKEVLLFLISDLADALLHDRANPDASANAIQCTKSVRSVDWMPTIRTLLQDPINRIWDVVSKLFSLQVPPVSKQVREKVAELLRVYIGEDGAEVEQTASKAKMYTVEMLLPRSKPVLKGKGVENPSVVQQPATPSATVDSWTLCPDFNWSLIPIGGVPGSSLEKDQLELSGVKWELLEAESDFQAEDEFESTSRKRTGERFDWNTLIRKRRRRGGLSKDTPVDI